MRTVIFCGIALANRHFIVCDDRDTTMVLRLGYFVPLQAGNSVQCGEHHSTVMGVIFKADTCELWIHCRYVFVPECEFEECMKQALNQGWEVLKREPETVE